MSRTLDRGRISSQAGLIQSETDDLYILGDVHGRAIGIVDDVAYIGFSQVVAPWALERACGHLLVARIADGMGRPCHGWQMAAARSIEGAMTRIVADSETEGWDR